MYNRDIPSPAELPSSRQLIRSTAVAATAAAVLLVVAVLPAEYGIDPTGLGRVLGLTEMGEIKVRLAQEAGEDAAAAASVAAGPAQAAARPGTETPGPAPAGATAVPAEPLAVPSPSAALPWRDEMRFTLTPGQGTEIKLRMMEGETARYAWAVQGGVVNFDTHGDGGGRSISYEKGRAVASDEGELIAAFTGNHGWYWRNRGQADVSVVLRTGGTYSDIQRVK